MNDEQLQKGIEALRAGDRRTARRIFGQVVNDEPDNHTAWWYLAAVLEDPEQKIHCLRQVLRLRPDHAEAAGMLARLEKHLAQATPSTGMQRPPVLDAEDAGDGLVVVREREDGEEKGQEEPDDDGVEASSGAMTVMITAVAIALVAIVGTVVLVWTGAASEFLGIRGPEPSPTPRPLSFDVKACVASDDESTSLVFINNTGVIIDVLQGPKGEETYLLTLAPDEQGSVETRPGVPVRYAVSTKAEGVAGGGAIIEVPQGNTCRVPIQ